MFIKSDCLIKVTIDFNKVTVNLAYLFSNSIEIFLIYILCIQLI